MLSNKVYKRMNEVEDQRDFNELLLIFQMSESSSREEAIRELKKMYPEFSPVVKTNAAIMADIEAGAADISDINQ